VVRASADGLDRDRWRELAELGVFGLTLPEADGGTGLAAADAVVVFEELGRAVVPGPLVASSLAAGAVPGVVGGDTVVTLVGPAPGGPGSPVLVEHLDAADVVLVLPADGTDGDRGDGTDGPITAVDAAAVRAAARSVEPLDPATPVSLVEALPAGDPVPGLDAAGLRRSGSLLTTALLLGIAEATTGLALSYAQERTQFGRAIGSFQAVKHLVADMFARTEVARAAAYAAGVLVDEPDQGDAARAVAAARVMATRAAVANGKACIQVHGGIGFTWEADPHLFLKRAWALAPRFGSLDEAAEEVARHLVPAGRPAGPAGGDT
jgi:alkylation response protein AidB-like acyl-CoA dehydrogenase